MLKEILKLLIQIVVFFLGYYYLINTDMKTIYDKVKEFNETFGVELKNNVTARAANGMLNYNLMEEENEEYINAVLNNDELEVYDALLDQLYVLIGNFQKHGISFDLIEKGIEEVHSSNMSKLEDGEVIKREDGKVLKGKYYFRPNLKDILNIKNNGDQTS